MNIIWLEGSDITKINYDLLKIQGVLNKDYISKADALYMRVYNQHLYLNNNDLYSLAGHYLSSIAQGHIFPDGNKRTALIATSMFLNLNDITLAISKDEQVSLVLDCATHQITNKDAGNLLKYLNTKALKLYALSEQENVKNSFHL